MTSPVSASSIRRLRPIERATGTAGVWQNQPPLPPGSAKPADSAAIARSHDATSWHPAAVARPCTRAMTTCGTDCIVFIRSVHNVSSSRTPIRSRAATSPKSCPAENTGPAPASTMPVASDVPASRTAASSSARWSAESELRRAAQFMVIVTVSPSRLTRMCSYSVMPRR